MVTGKDVQIDIATGMNSLANTTSSYSQMKRAHGSDWTKWPQDSNWYKGLSALNKAKQEAGPLVTPTSPTAEFTQEQV